MRPAWAACPGGRHRTQPCVVVSRSILSSATATPACPRDMVRTPGAAPLAIAAPELSQRVDLGPCAYVCARACVCVHVCASLCVRACVCARVERVGRGESKGKAGCQPRVSPAKTKRGSCDCRNSCHVSVSLRLYLNEKLNVRTYTHVLRRFSYLRINSRRTWSCLCGQVAAAGGREVVCVGLSLAR